MVKDIIYNQVYYVEPESSDIVLNPIAIRPCLKEGHLLFWEDTGRGTLREISKITMSHEKEKDGSPLQFSVVSDNGEHITFTLMDLKIYNSKVKERVWGEVDFKTDKELRDFYLNTAFRMG